MNAAILSTENLAKIFKVLSRPDALKVFLLAGEGIENSVSAIAELNISQKKYYTRLGELVDIGFIRKTGGTYRQTPIGNILCTRLLPAMGEVYEARDMLEILVQLDGTEVESGVRNLILDKLEIPLFADPTNVNTLDTYEAMVVDVIDLCDEAEESVLIASNYVDVRVMEATFRAVDRDVANKILMGKRSLPSKMQGLRMLFSVSFTKALINFASSTRDLKDVVRFVELPYTFCVVDGHRSIIEISDKLNESFIAALLVDDRVIGERLTKFHNTLWEVGEFQPALNAINAIKS